MIVSRVKTGANDTSLLATNGRKANKFSICCSSILTLTVMHLLLLNDFLKVFTNRKAYYRLVQIVTTTLFKTYSFIIDVLYFMYCMQCVYF